MTNTGLEVVWDGGGDGRLLSLRDDAIVVRSSRAFAPGSRPAGSLGTGDVLRLKTHRCRRDESDEAGAFIIEGRTLDMSRALKQKIASLLGA